MKVRFAFLAVLPLLQLMASGCSDREADSPPTRTAEATAQASAAASATRTQAKPSATGASTATTPPATASGPAEFDGSRALSHIERLATTIGPRVAGSAAETTAVAYIRDQFKASGYDVEIQEFSFEGDPFRPATVQAGGKTIDGYALSGSVGGTVSAASVFVGLGDAAGIGGQNLRGKVAVADRGTLRFGEKYDNVKASGAVALVILNNEDGDLLGNLFKPSDIPVVSLSGGAAGSVRAAAQAGGTISVKAPSAEVTKSLNVIARPAPGAKCLLVVGGHHDTVPGAPGAHDNASGTAETIELARAFAADGLDNGLCFATFGAEESGLHGSKALAAKLKAAGELPKIMVNLDTTGLGTRIDLIGSAELTKAALAVAQKLSIEAAITELGANFGSDHQSFSDVGVPVLFFATNDIGKLHTPGDTTATIQPQTLENSGDLAFAVIRQLLAQVARG